MTMYVRKRGGNAGRLFYVFWRPYRVPHDGVSLNGECMTYSIGFRAPAQKDLVTAAASAAHDHLSSDQGLFYTDPDLDLQEHAGEITSSSLMQMKALVHQSLSKVLDDDVLSTQWIGIHLTSPKRPRLDDYPIPLWNANAGE